MTRNLAADIANLKASRMTQFSPLIVIPASNQVAGVYAEVDLPQAVNKLWLPQVFVQPGSPDTIVSNPNGTVLGIRLNVAGAVSLPWGLDAKYVSKFDGPVYKLFVTLLDGEAAAMALYGLVDCDVEHAGYQFGAGTPDNSTTNPVAP